MNTRSTKTSTKNAVLGLSLSGTVTDRVRRMVPRDDPSIEIVTYTVQDGSNRKYFVDDYAPNDYHDVGSQVYFPVYVKTYKRKNGEPSYTLNVQKAEAGRGERF